MKLLRTFGWRFFVLPFLVAMAMAQGTPSPAPAASAAAGSGPAVPYASLSQLNLLLSQLEQVAQATQVDLAKLRIEKWKIDSNTKRSTSADVDSLQRNLQMALPEIIAQLRASPENVGATFKLYRNLDALFDVLGPVVESAGAFGAKDEFQSVQNDLSAIESWRNGWRLWPLRKKASSPNCGPKFGICRRPRRRLRWLRRKLLSTTPNRLRKS
jgi:hypothetical protein